MRPHVLILIAVLSLACAGDPEPAAEAAAPVEAPATSPPAGESATADEVPEKVSFKGGSRVALVIDEDWTRINEFTRQFYEGELTELHENFSDAAKQELSLDELMAMRTALIANHGTEVDVVASTKEEKDGYKAYKRASRFSTDERLVEVAWVIAADDSIAGLYVTPERGDQD